MNNPQKNLVARLKVSQLKIEALELTIGRRCINDDVSLLADLKNKYSTVLKRMYEINRARYDPPERFVADTVAAWSALDSAFGNQQELNRFKPLKIQTDDIISQNSPDGSHLQPFRKRHSHNATRISTRVDILLKEVWIAWNALERAFTRLG